ncbi:hypothetical protein [Pseudonocardia sp.]|uniref:hypothetical protein n=1 Tax=Pseudonocardia sp. TaxID=60912 RepID=UPI002613A44C|nr:hypothetical protein [Pseudonocardia sp.]
MGEDLDGRLAELARAGAESAQLPPAARLRRRGARRQRTRIVAAGATAAAIVVGVVVGTGALSTGGPPAAGTPTGPTTGPTAGPTSGPGTTATAAPPDADVPAADRQVALRTPEGHLLAIGDDGYLTTDRDGVEATTGFVFVPVAPGAERYLLKTPGLTTGGEPGCLYGTGEGAEPGRGIATTACDTSDDTQLFTVARSADFPAGALSLGNGNGWVSVDGILVSVSLDFPIGTPLTPEDLGRYVDPLD